MFLSRCRRRWPVPAAIIQVLLLSASPAGTVFTAQTTEFDHDYRAYARLLRDHISGARVDYAKLTRSRQALDGVATELGQISETDLDAWSREHRLAYWINAYNIFTLKVIVDNYPIRGSWFGFSPRNSIKRIDGVWDRLTWKAGGREVTLDQIEHEILRPGFDEPRFHFTVNCAAIGCPPLRSEPYRVDLLDRQLILAARDFLASDLGLQVNGSTLRVSSLFKWYGEDFISQFAHLIDTDRSEKERAILGVIAQYGPAKAAALAQEGRARIRFLKYDWALNNITG